MPKDLSYAVSQQLSAQQKHPVNLFELGLSSATLYYAASNIDIIFPTGGTLYTAKTITYGNIQQSAEKQIERVTVNFDNVSRDMSAYASVEEFKNKPLIIKRIYIGAISGTTDYVEVFKGSMETPSSIGRKTLIIGATVGEALNKKTSQRQYQRQCSNIFGDGYCNADNIVDMSSATYTITGNISVGGTTYFTYTSHVTGAVNDYWNYGKVEVGNSGTTYKRTVSDYTVAGTSKVIWEVALPVTPGVTYRYILRKGCAKTWDSCSSSLAYGPDANNQLNFGGYIHIARKKEVGWKI